ncbi:hypothetical protein OPV22_022070 [Ensete ventricosum]|uniref:Secreted protein n=1 Tax=Ensete ventricosum TaxID=4639 RepID=A0AAV8QP11_ENSVE|nr:hypothetical protein OPV22_022070 [Ensete ventricosum]
MTGIWIALGCLVEFVGSSYHGTFYNHSLQAMTKLQACCVGLSRQGEPHSERFDVEDTKPPQVPMIHPSGDAFS